MKRKFYVMLLALVIIIPSIYADDAKRENRDIFLTEISAEMDYILLNYYGNMDEKTLRMGILNGMHEVVDPWTKSYSFEEYMEFIDSLRGDYVGLGVYVNDGKEYIEIIEVIEGSAAKEAGLKVGDRIYAVESKAVKDIGMDEALKLIHGEKDTTVNITVKRKDKSVQEDIMIVRKPFEIKSVKHYKQKGVDVIKIMQFGERTYEEVKKILDSNKFENGIILDLRDNPGGYLDVCRRIADEFLPKDALITNIESNRGKETLLSQVEGRDDKIVVLVNCNSASASELLTAALKDNNRALVIGEKTFGKGLIQELGVYNDRYIKLTEGEYKSPDEKLINVKGVSPDIWVTLEEELKAFNSDAEILLSYTSFDFGEYDDEILGVKQRFAYIGKKVNLNKYYDKDLENLVRELKRERSLCDNGLIDAEFKTILEEEVKFKAMEITREKQMKRAITEIKKL